MIPYYGEDNSGFGQAFQNQFKRSLGIPGEPLPVFDKNKGGSFDPTRYRAPDAFTGPIDTTLDKFMNGPFGTPGEPPVGGGGGPMPIPDGGPGWRNQGGGSADRWGNTGQVTSDGNGNTSAVTRGDVWGGVGPDPQGGLQLGRGGPDLRADWEKDQDYLRDLGYFALDTFMTPGGRGGPRQGTPEDYARWKASRGNGLYTEGTGFGGGGPMPVPTGGPNWRTPPTDQPVGGGGGPMPVPPPWVRFGGKPEDYGVTMEFGGPGAINPPGMGPNELRNLYNPPAPPPAGPNPQASPSPNWGTGFNGGGLGAGLNPFVQVPRFGQVAISPFAPKRGGLGGQDNAPPPPMARPFGGGFAPKRGGLGGQDNAPPPPAVNPGMGGGAQRLGTPFQFNPQPKENGWNWGDMSNIYRRRF